MVYHVVYLSFEFVVHETTGQSISKPPCLSPCSTTVAVQIGHKIKKCSKMPNCFATTKNLHTGPKIKEMFKNDDFFQFNKNLIFVLNFWPNVVAYVAARGARLENDDGIKTGAGFAFACSKILRQELAKIYYRTCHIFSLTCENAQFGDTFSCGT